MNDTISISNTVSKADSDEEVSLLRASMADASGQVKGGIESAPISNERIQKNDPLLGTYTVTSDAIHGGMGSVWRVRHRYWNVDLAMKRPQPVFFAEAGEVLSDEF